MKNRGQKPSFHEVRHLHNDEELVEGENSNENVKNKQIRKYLKASGHEGKGLRQAMHIVRREGVDALINNPNQGNVVASFAGPNSPVKLSQEEKDRLFPSTANRPNVQRNRELAKQFTSDELHEGGKEVQAAAGTTFKVTEPIPAENTVATKENENEDD
tara:strand:+ start:1287 stop:1763 length:477 start_codon:yes stop_codon:yes gene_type:complete